MNNAATGEARASVTSRHAVVIRFGRLGDMVMLDPLLELLHRRYGAPCWLFGSGPWSSELYAQQPHTSRIWSLAGRHTPLLMGLAWWRVLWALRRERKSPIYVCEDTASQCKRIRRLLALAGVDPGRCQFWRPDPALEAHEHCIDTLLRFGRQTPPAIAASAYPSPAAASASPRLRVSEADQRVAAAWIRAQGTEGRPLVLVQPGNRKTMRGGLQQRGDRTDDKAWPVTHWARLLRCVQARMPQALVVLCGTWREQRLLHRIRAHAGLSEIAVLRSTPSRLLGLCTLAHSMISVDTGPAHLAAAVGTPLVVLFGRDKPRRWSPRSACDMPVISLGGPPTSNHVAQIPVQAVFEAWLSLPARSAQRDEFVTPVMPRRSHL